MKFKEVVQFISGSRGIDYQAIDPAYDPVTNAIFQGTSIFVENDIEYIVGNYTGLLTLGAWDGILPITIVKKIGMGILGELLPMAVLLEVEDFKADNTNAANKREIAVQILMFIYADRPLDVYGGAFTTMMTRLVTHTALTGAEAIAIQKQLQSDEYVT